MARKVYYSKPLQFFWKECYREVKAQHPYLSIDEIFTLIRRNLLYQSTINFQDSASQNLTISGLDLWREDANGNLMHIFFLDKHLKNFLEKTPLSDLDGVKKFLYENGKEKIVVHTYSKETKKCVMYNFALHLPYESQGYAFSLYIEPEGNLELFFSLGSEGGRMSDRFYKDVNNKTDKISVIHANIFRLVINTIAYMNCFPECVSDGVPENLFQRDEDLSAKNFTFKVSEKIQEEKAVPTSRIPHFRKGHFRQLHSDHFVNKKGQIVFISETMVKGKAKTVSTSENIDEFGSGTH